jgi:hypothetical protein
LNISYPATLPPYSARRPTLALPSVQSSSQVLMKAIARLGYELLRVALPCGNPVDFSARWATVPRGIAASPDDGGGWLYAPGQSRIGPQASEMVRRLAAQVCKRAAHSSCYDRSGYPDERPRSDRRPAPKRGPEQAPKSPQERRGPDTYLAQGQIRIWPGTRTPTGALLWTRCRLRNAGHRGNDSDDTH